MTVTSSALLCHLSVSSAQLEKDRLLQVLVTQLVSPLQLKVSQSSSAASALELTIADQTLTQRNTIIKTLVGWIGVKQNHSGRSLVSHPSTPVSSSALTAWMSVADSVRTSSCADDFLSNLNLHLETHAFLLPKSHTASIADLDLALALFEKDDKTTTTPTSSSYQEFAHVLRWSYACHALLTEFGCKGLPALEQSALLSGHSPVFFDGTEDGSLAYGSSGTKANQSSKNATKDGNKPAISSNNIATAPVGGKNKKLEKAAKKAAAPPAQATTEATSSAEVDISALDIRVGKILKAWHHPEAEKLFCEEIDLGNGEVRQIASGLRPFYQTEDLIGRLVLVLCNLKKRNLVGFASRGMVLCASNAEHTQVKFVVPPVGANPGDRVIFGEYKGEPEAESKVAKKKIFEKLAPDLKTNEQGKVVWKDAIGEVAGAEVTAELTGAHVS